VPFVLTCLVRWSQNSLKHSIRQSKLLTTLNDPKAVQSTNFLPQAEHYIKMSMYGYHFLPRACAQFADLMEKENKPAEAKLWRDRAKEAKVIDWRASD
jgi:hypothetical protein